MQPQENPARVLLGLLGNCTEGLLLMNLYCLECMANIVTVSGCCKPKPEAMQLNEYRQQSEYCFTSLSVQSSQYRDRRKPEVGTILYSYRMTWRVLYSAHNHRQHCALQAFQQFGALYMHNFDDTHLTRPGFESSTSEFRATTGPNEPSGPANIILPAACISWRMCFDIKKLIGTCPYKGFIDRLPFTYWQLWHIFYFKFPIFFVRFLSCICGANRSYATTAV